MCFIHKGTCTMSSSYLTVVLGGQEFITAKWKLWSVIAVHPLASVVQMLEVMWRHYGEKTTTLQWAQFQGQKCNKTWTEVKPHPLWRSCKSCTGSGARLLWTACTDTCRPCSGCSELDHPRRGRPGMEGSGKNQFIQFSGACDYIWCPNVDSITEAGRNECRAHNDKYLHPLLCKVDFSAIMMSFKTSLSGYWLHMWRAH